MIPGRYNYDTESTQKTQNFSSGSKTPKQPMSKKLNLNWDRKLEKLLNNTNDQDDYFQIYSDASNTTISTICINSNESRFTDSYYSDTDATHRDDIVIELSERAFYNTKVNPFPPLNLSPKISPEKELSKIIGGDKQNEDVVPTNVVTEGVGLINIRNNADFDLTSVANEANDQKIENDTSADGASKEIIDARSNEDMAPADGTTTGIADADVQDSYSATLNGKFVSEDTDIKTNSDCVSTDEANNQNNDFVAATDGVQVEVLDDHSNEAMTCDFSYGLANEVTDVPISEDLVPADAVQPDVTDTQTNLIHTDNTNEVNNCCNNVELASPVDEITNCTEEQENNGNLRDENISENDTNDDQSQNLRSIPDVNANQINSVENVVENIPVPEVATSMETTDLIRRESTSSRNRNDDEVKSTDSKPSSTYSKNNSSLEMRKKRYRKTVDSNHRRNVERQLSKSSGCTKVTSTTTVHVTTNDDSTFDALADMPEFINSSVIDLASSYIENRLRQEKNQRTRCIDFNSAPLSSSSSFTPSWRNEKLSSMYDEYISPRDAYKQLNILLTDGTSENLKAVMYDEYNGIRFDDDVASSEDEFLSDVDDLNLTNSNWTPPESELRRQVAVIVKKIHPLENNYSTIIEDMLCKYLNYIHSKQRIAKINRIVDCVNKPVSQQEKTEMLIRREIDDKKLNREFYHSPMEPSDFTELGERRREAIIRKYTRCHNDRKFCYSYFKRSIDDRPVTKLDWRIAKLKQELELIFA